jgi:hypothetical protein
MVDSGVAESGKAEEGSRKLKLSFISLFLKFNETTTFFIPALNISLYKKTQGIHESTYSI